MSQVKSERKGFAIFINLKSDMLDPISPSGFVASLVAFVEESLKVLMHADEVKGALK